METENKDSPALRTPNQEVLVVKILQSGKLLDREYQQLKNIWTKQIVTSIDAGIFIEYVLAALRFRRHFLNGKHKAFKRCFFCSSRDDVKRYENLKMNCKYWICDSCKINIEGDSTVPVKEIN